jgi:uncharacterized membrane protein YfcA
MEIVLIGLASAFAGFVDAIVGGGGLILVPALFSVYPTAAPATLFGTNKSASVWGTALATWRYSQQLHFDTQLWLPAAACTMLGAFVGAWGVTQVSAEFLRQLLPIVLALVLLYTLWRKDMGHTHAPRFSGRAQQGVAALIGLTIGFYDGFFGPGTGSFFLFLFVRVLGYDFLNASLAAKFLNLASNIAAIALFASKGHVWWHLTLALALCNMAGSILGARMALRHGSGFVRVMFIVVVSALIAKTSWNVWCR